MNGWLWPWVVWLLPLPVVVWYALPAARRQQAALRVPFLMRLPSAGQNSGRTSDKPTLLLLTLIWLSLLLAAARPVWHGEPLAMPLTGRDLMLVVDISGSMKTRDMVLDGLAARRLDVVKKVAGEFIQRREGDRIGLVLFGDNAYLQTPLTFDRTTARLMLNEAEIGLAGQSYTAVGDGLGLAVKYLRKLPQQERVVVLLTDGANNAGTLAPQQAAKLAKQAGVRVYSIGFGAKQQIKRTMFGNQVVNPSADLDERSLKAMASLTNGQFFRATDSQDLQHIYTQIDQIEPAANAEQRLRPRTELYWWPLLIALVLSWLLFFRQTLLSAEQT